MVATRSLWLLLPRPLRELSADLAAVMAVVASTVAVTLVPMFRETPLRIPIGLAFLLFVPGYAFVAALFPGASEPPSEGATADRERRDSPRIGRYETTELRSGIDSVERVFLSFGFSIAVVPLVGLLLTATPWGIRLSPLVVSVSVFTLAAAAIAAGRRRALPAEDRFRVPFRGWLAAARGAVLEPDSRADAALTVVLIASVLVGVGAVGYTVAVPPDGSGFSTVYLLTEGEDGTVRADGYPTEFVRGESREVIVGIDNRERTSTEYTVVVLEQTVELAAETPAPTGNETSYEVDVTEQRELDRFGTTLEPDESWHYEYGLEPTMVGENQRVVWLLFRGDEESVPVDPSVDDADYRAHLWVNVSDG